MLSKTLLVLALLSVSFAGDFTIGQNTYLLNGEHIQLMSAAFHYFRVHPDYWEDTFKKIANAGLNTVETYIAWNIHEPRPGEYHFEGGKDIERYLNLAQKYNLLVIIRPGPYICTEWDFGGLPYWLLKEDGIELRTKDPKYLQHVLNCFDHFIYIPSNTIIHTWYFCIKGHKNTFTISSSFYICLTNISHSRQNNMELSIMN